jgi:NAD(P)H-dependent flavin oxidoreductase YrpB (nitropropane dioxygenase family)
MKNRLVTELRLRVPLFAFTNSREVVVEVSRAGGFGVLGAVPYSAEELAEHLDWIDAHIDGRPYGVDVVMPASTVAPSGGALDKDLLHGMIPEAQRKFVDELLARYDVPPLPEGAHHYSDLPSWIDQLTRAQIDVALSHPIRLLANALGPPPADVIARAHEHGVQVAALAGSVRHAQKQVAAGVDIVVAQGTEAGGHTGDVATMVLVPEVVDAVHPAPVLAAGGIGSGRQLAAALALGAAGAWTGSIWLVAAENQMCPQAVKEKLLAAGSRDTVRSRAMTGKPARQLRTPWTEAWESKESPGTLPLPLQFMATSDAINRIHYHAAHTPSSRARELLGSPVGQIVGRMNAVRPAAQIVEQIAAELERAVEQVGQWRAHVADDGPKQANAQLL